VNAVAPGPIETPIFEKTGLPKEVLDEFAKRIVESVPMKRFGKPEEVAGAAGLFRRVLHYRSGVECGRGDGTALSSAYIFCGGGQCAAPLYFAEEGSGEDARSMSRNHLWAVSPGA
jgi:hypothetical protein